jgi:Leucine-rich repeat (LRR) protein
MQKALFPLLGLLLLGACADYRFTVNDKVVYTPEPLFSDYDIPDSQLNDCIFQTIKDHTLNTASQLEELNCSHAGVESLQGLQTFTSLKRLKLSSNAIYELGPLSDLRELTDLHIDNNQVVSLGALRGLPKLTYVDLRGNENLNCTELDAFAHIPDIRTDLPEHCL